jgi:hypothetical protein
MELLPTGQKSSHAIFMYSFLVCIDFLISRSVFYSPSKEGSFYFMIVVVQVGLGTFVLSYLPGLLHSIPMEIGISKDMHYPVCKL